MYSEMALLYGTYVEECVRITEIKNVFSDGIAVEYVLYIGKSTVDTWSKTGT